MNLENFRIEFVIALVCVVLILGVLVRIALEAEYAPDGETLSQLQTRIHEIKNENMLLKEQVYTDESLTHIAGEAAKMGFIQTANFIYLWPTY